MRDSGHVKDQREDGRDGLTASYDERLTPPWWLWLAAACMTGSLGVAYGAAYGSIVGAAVFVVAAALVAVVLFSTSPRVRVDEAVVRAGRARLPLRFAGPATALNPAQARSLRSTEADPRAYLVLRTWASGSAVRIEVRDPEDPHPYWMITTRHPDALAAAIDSARRPGSDAV